ncbi:MBL fold metallo-hydrolase [Adhaeribacter sp. BT258]|uniref:MBL fold metallo-hydrolase n=1 Tax=Adhaeribacter terrigena TaxID=2793070 RepID=A0ABS1BW79_9BACT|nr:MBL fold metallo-hydrolase [Adhaeribacter terrigena]MBK0401351.1 MBL fold metallo-hydrolase [Adhaeribacter terrigena]
MTVTGLTFNPFAENTYLLYDETKECVVVDPGCSDAAEKAKLKQFISDNGLKVVKLLNTHCHIDHVLGNKFVADTYNVGLEMHEADLPTLKAIPAYAPSYGFTNYEEVLPATFLAENDTVSFGNTQLKVIFTPGHAPGHVVFYDEKGKNLIAGDVLFQRSIGRTDLPGGDFDTLISSIKTKLFVLPEDVKVYPGHGPSTTMGEEKRENPFLR